MHGDHQHQDRHGEKVYVARGVVAAEERRQLLQLLTSVQGEPQVSEVDAASLGVVPDPTDRLHRPPMHARFRTRVIPESMAFTFWLVDIHTDPDRLKRPVKRTATGWQEIGWKEAFALVEEGITRVQRAHGRDAVATYFGNPTVHSLGAMLFAPTFAKILRTKNRYSATSVDQLPHHLASLWMFGHPLLIPIPEIGRAHV